MLMKSLRGTRGHERLHDVSGRYQQVPLGTEIGDGTNIEGKVVYENFIVQSQHERMQ